MLRKILITLAIVLPLAYGGAKLYVTHFINDTAEEVIAEIAPVAAVKYESTTSSLIGGMVGLTGVTVQPRNSNNYYSIGAIKLRSDNIFAFIGMNVERGKVPKMFDVEVDKLSIPLSGTMLEKDHGDLGLMGDLYTRFGILACGRRTGFSESDLAQMGIEQITTNMNMKFVGEPAQNDVRMIMRVDTPGINVASADIRLVAPGGRLRPRGVMRAAPLLKSLVFRFRDQGWHKRRDKFCMAQAGMTHATYINAHVAAVKGVLARMGYSVSDDLIAAYRSFLKDDGSMTLSISPQSPIDLSTLGLYSTQEAIEYLAPTLVVNGRTVKRLNVARMTPETTPGTITNVAAVPAASSGRYKAIPFDALGRYIGRQVRLTTDSDHIFAGKLIRVGDRTATVDVTRFGRNDKELVLLSRVAKTELLTPIRRAKFGAH